MNKIKFEFFKSACEVSESVLDGSSEVEFVFPNTASGYLSIGPRIIKVEGGIARFSLSSFASGIQGCYLMLDGQRYDLPSLEKCDNLFHLLPSDERARLARVRYLKELEARISALEADMAEAKEKIFGRKGIL